MASKPRVISYVRFSTPEQLKGDSRRRQMELSERWAKEHGLQIDEKLSDLGVSAYRGANSTTGDLSNFLRLVELGHVPRGSILLVEELDRISRQNPEDALHLFLGIIKSGVVVVTLNTGDVFESGKIEIGKLMIAVVKFCTANDESVKKSARLSAAWKAKRDNAASKPLTRRLPSWCDLVDGKIVGVPEKVKIVEHIFQLAIDGHGSAFIAGKLNAAKGVKLPSSGEYGRKYIIHTLKNRAVLGEYQPEKVVYDENKVRRLVNAGEPVKGYYPVIISESTFYAAQNGLRKRRTAGGKIAKHVNLFNGLLYSSKDGSSMVVIDKGRGAGRAYAPISVIDKRAGAVKMAPFPLKVFEAAILSRISDTSFLAPAKRPQSRDVQKEIAATLEEIDGLKAKVSEVQDSLLTAKASQTQSVVGLLGKLDVRIAERMEHLEQLKGEAAAAIGTDYDQWIELFAFLARHAKKKLTHDERLELRNAVRRVVERIEVLFGREGFDHTCECKVQLRNGQEFKDTFRACRVETRTKDKLGHWIAGEAGDTKYQLVQTLKKPGAPKVILRSPPM